MYFTYEYNGRLIQGFKKFLRPSFCMNVGLAQRCRHVPEKDAGSLHPHRRAERGEDPMDSAKQGVQSSD